MKVLQPFQGETKGLDGAFQPLEQVDRHQRLEASFAVLLLQGSAAASDLGVVEILVLGKPAGKDVLIGA